MSRASRLPGRMLLLGLLTGLTLAGVAQVEAQRAAAGPPDWPCVQRLIPELAWGTIWTGPPLDELKQAWWEDEEVGRVVRFATSRTTPKEQALERVRAFVESVDEEDAEQRLTLLFSGLFELTDRERKRTIERIRQASRAQLTRLETISAMVDELEERRADDEATNEAEIERLSEALFWEQRTFQHRQQTLPAMCDQPYLLEEELARMVRVIMARMP
ncbi:MAG: hypothetical protein LPK08_10990 [Halomonas sp.]|uniref:Uncharacterized protein n=1 Tax=Halomonas sulfidivorans TaxID=2733488 RepID=A0ABX7WNJ2_9GAMM|nr:hypothetical protein [Halomonas sulfidivorans]MDX5378023.1 hypothetical protein [Halomonas sp.]MDX5503364.1 hypothetical protein [Halomonas sp.]QTP60613.1 hypothetical protein HNO53_18980 [Halomonas sulfidivorans]